MVSDAEQLSLDEAAGAMFQLPDCCCSTIVILQRNNNMTRQLMSTLMSTSQHVSADINLLHYAKAGVGKVFAQRATFNAKKIRRAG